MAESLKRVRIFGMPVDAVNTEAVVAEVDAGLQAGLKRRTLLAMNPEKVYALEKDAELRRFFENSDVLIPDGIGLVWAIRLLTGIRLIRLTGADLMEDLCVLAAKRGYRVFFYGANEEVNAGATAILEKRYAGMKVVGRRNGFVSDAEMESLIDQINACHPDIVFVALGSPRQERWMQKYVHRLDAGLFQGLGGTLDTITGHVKRAHPLVQKMGLEWLSRLILEPKRIKRQMILPKFAFRVLRAKLGLTAR